MADWIKMRTDLYRHPKVILIAANVMAASPDMPAALRNVMRNAAVGALVSVWGVMRHRGLRRDDDLFVPGIGKGVVDDIADMDGFSDAMADAQWLLEEENGLVFPRFFADHNVDPGAKNRERQRRFRDKKRNAPSNGDGNVTVTLRNGQSKRESKRRDISANADTPLPPELSSEAFLEAWGRWQEYRKEIKKPLTKAMCLSQLKKLAEMGEARGIAMIENTIFKGWQGLQEPESAKPRKLTTLEKLQERWNEEDRVSGV